MKDVFHNDFDAESFKKALTSKEYAWMFSELIQMFLSAIFSLQEDEAEEYNENGGIQEYNGEIYSFLYILFYFDIHWFL